MATYKKCDRCKTSNEENKWLTFYEIQQELKEGYDSSQMHEFTVNDICDNCAKEIKQFATTYASKPKAVQSGL